MTSPDPASPLQPFPDPIPGIIPFGTVTLFAGASGAGKSTMLDEWLVRWRDGRTICGHQTNKPTALYLLIADRTWADDHQDWFRKLGWPDIPYYAIAEDPALPVAYRDPAAAHRFLLYCLDKLKPIPGSHVVVDPITPLFIAGNPNDQRPVAWTLLDMGRICTTRQINITCTAYFGKQKADKTQQYTRPIDRIAGSGAFAGYSHCQVYITEPEPDQPYHTLGWKPRHAPEGEFKFTRQPSTGLFVPFELYAELDRLEAVLACVPDEPTKTSLILHRVHTKLGLSEKRAEFYLRQLKSQGRIVRVGHGLLQRAKVC